MQLFLINFILIAYYLFSFVRADMTTDAIHLQGLASDTADTIFASLNGTAYLVGAARQIDESQLMVPEYIGPCISSHRCHPRSRFDRDIKCRPSRLGSQFIIGDLVDLLQSSSGTANVTLNDAYFNFVDSMLYLADTVQRRGRLFHSELNLPVYQALQNLSSAVSTYGHDLTSHSLIQRNSTIRTLTTGSAIVNAQSAWANNQNYPGKREISSWSG
ncbi:hypothetical protein KCU83_g6754, partial [Aureobasidium melanogenum]